jgi:hypothetical protein
MVLWKLWSDLRRRFALALAMSLVIVWENVHRMWEPSQRDFFLRPYPTFVETSWLQGGTEFVVLLAVLLSIGGIPGELRGGPASLSLSLPVARRRWILTHAALAAGLTLATSLAVFAAIAVAFRVAGVAYPLSAVARNAAINSLGATAWIGLTILATVVTRSSLRATLVVFAATVALRTLLRMDALTPVYTALWPWSVWRVMDPMVWASGVPGRALATTLFLSLGGLALAVIRFDRTDS